MRQRRLCRLTDERQHGAVVCPGGIAEEVLPCEIVQHECRNDLFGRGVGFENDIVVAAGRIEIRMIRVGFAVQLCQLFRHFRRLRNRHAEAVFDHVGRGGIAAGLHLRRQQEVLPGRVVAPGARQRRIFDAAELRAVRRVAAGAEPEPAHCDVPFVDEVFVARGDIAAAGEAVAEAVDVALQQDVRQHAHEVGLCVACAGDVALHAQHRVALRIADGGQHRPKRVVAGGIAVRRLQAVVAAVFRRIENVAERTARRVHLPHLRVIEVGFFTETHLAAFDVDEPHCVLDPEAAFAVRGDAADRFIAAEEIAPAVVQLHPAAVKDFFAGNVHNAVRQGDEAPGCIRGGGYDAADGVDQPILADSGGIGQALPDVCRNLIGIRREVVRCFLARRCAHGQRRRVRQIHAVNALTTVHPEAALGVMHCENRQTFGDGRELVDDAGDQIAAAQNVGIRVGKPERAAERRDGTGDSAERQR